MAVAVALLGSQFLTTNSTQITVTATPAANSTILVFVGTTGNASMVSGAVADTQGKSYSTVKAVAVKNTSLDAMYCYLVQNYTASSTTWTFDPATAGMTTTGQWIAVVEITGLSRTDSTAVRQTGIKDNAGLNVATAPVMGVACLTTNTVVEAIFNPASPAAITPRTGYTEILDSGYSTPTTGGEIAYRITGETGTTLTIGANTSNSCGIAVELDASAAVASTAFPIEARINHYIPLICR